MGIERARGMESSSESGDDVASSSSSDEDDPERAIFAAVTACDVDGLRRCLAAGVDPDVLQTGGFYPGHNGHSPLCVLVVFRQRSHPSRRLQEKLECISVLLEAGASVDLRQYDSLHPLTGRTPLHRIAINRSRAYHAVIAALVEAGADVNFTDEHGKSVLATAARHGTAAAVRTLISAGAVDLDRALEVAISHGTQRNCAPLLRACAAIPAETLIDINTLGVSGRAVLARLEDRRAYIRKIRAAGGYKSYENAHRQRLVAIFASKFPHLPADMLGRVLEYSWDIGGH